MNESDARIAFFKTGTYRRHWLVPTASIVLFLGSVVWLRYPKAPLREYCLLFWLVGPPLFFQLEYWWIGMKAKLLPDVESFKFRQDLAAKFWVVGFGLLIFIYNGKILESGG
jgi:hypothetical protein